MTHLTYQSFGSKPYEAYLNSQVIERNLVALAFLRQAITDIEITTELLEEMDKEAEGFFSDKHRLYRDAQWKREPPWDAVGDATFVALASFAIQSGHTAGGILPSIGIALIHDL